MDSSEIKELIQAMQLERAPRIIAGWATFGGAFGWAGAWLVIGGRPDFAAFSAQVIGSLLLMYAGAFYSTQGMWPSKAIVALLAAEEDIRETKRQSQLLKNRLHDWCPEIEMVPDEGGRVYVLKLGNKALTSGHAEALRAAVAEAP